MTNLRSALLLAIALAITADRARSEVTDEPGPSARNGRPLNLEQLQEFAAPLATYDLMDVATRQQGRITFGRKTVSISWYFAAESNRAFLTRKGISCIIVRGDQNLTKCLTVSENRHSGDCRYLVQELRDKRAACVREVQEP